MFSNGPTPAAARRDSCSTLPTPGHHPRARTAEVPTTPIDGGPWLGDLPSRLLPRARRQWGVRGTLFPPVSQQAGPAGLSYTGDLLEPSVVLLPRRPRARVGERHTRHSLFALGDGE